MILKSRPNNKGTTAVEFALVAPVFLLLVFGIIDFGRYFFVQNTVQYATREGARLAMVGRTLQDGEGNPLTREKSIIETIKTNVSMAINPNDDDLTINIFPLGDGYVDPAGWEGMTDAGGPGSIMRVRTQYYHNFLTPLIGVFFSGGPCLIQAQTTYRNELFGA